MRQNITKITTFTLEGFKGMEKQRNLYICMFLIMYIGTILLNAVLVLIIYCKRALHEPLHIFVSSLACNSIYGSSSLLPHLMSHIASQKYSISLVGCLIQIYCLHTFNMIEFTMLAVMGYDRYIAICCPLHYQQIMSFKRLKSFIAFAWLYPLCSFALFEILTSQLSFCWSVIEKTYCSNYTLVKLSCSDITVNNIIGSLVIGLFLGPQVVMILFSYAQILRICIRSSKECKQKAIEKCTPHLLTVINYFIGCFFEVVGGRFDLSYIPYEIRIFMSLYFMVLPPMLNPIIYGISSQMIRSTFGKVCFIERYLHISSHFRFKH